MAKEENTDLNEPIVDVSEAVSKTDELFEQNKKQITIVGIGIAAVVIGFFLYKSYVVEPKEMKADSKIWVAEKNFNSDSLDLAIMGEGKTVPGFSAIADEFSGTESGNVAEYYLGVSELKRGNYELAIDHLKNFDTSNEILKAVSIGAIGDAYLEMGNINEAETYYRRAASTNSNRLTTPFYLLKLGMVLEEQGSNEDALEAFETIKKDYANSEFSININQYIGRVKQKLGK